MILHFKSDARHHAPLRKERFSLPAIFELGNHLFTRTQEHDTELGIRNDVWERGRHVPFPPPQSTAIGSLPSPIFFLFHPVSFPFSPSAEPGSRLRFHRLRTADVSPRSSPVMDISRNVRPAAMRGETSAVRRLRFPIFIGEITKDSKYSTMHATKV